MRNWIVILLIALASVGVGIWCLRRQLPGSKPRTKPGTVNNADPDNVSRSPEAVPNTILLPHPDDRMVATLEFDGPPGAVPLKRGEVVIGRHSSDDVRVPDVRVSRHHARLLARSDGGFEIHNLTAVRPEPNPMMVNGSRREYADIADGDVISLGGVSFQFRLAAA